MNSGNKALNGLGIIQKITAIAFTEIALRHITILEYSEYKAKSIWGGAVKQKFKIKKIKMLWNYYLFFLQSFKFFYFLLNFGFKSKSFCNIFASVSDCYFCYANCFRNFPL